MEFSTLEDQTGMVSVRLAGGIQLVNGRTANELSAVVDPANPNPFDATFSQVYYQGSGAFFDVTSSIKGGELGGLIEARDGIVGGVIRDLDAFAFSLAEEFNAQHRLGFGLVDGAAHDFFVDTASQPTVDDFARNLALSADVDPDQGGTLENIAAGATGGPTGAGAGDTAHAEILGNLRRGPVTVYLAGDTPGTPTGSSRSLSASLTDMIGDLGQKARTTSRALEQQEAVLSAVQDRRDSISGVSVDEEVANLVQLQTSFQANARVISTVNQLFADLLSAF
jgi:flagellar hook-associated protein 1 FlgK